jgi:RiboL-PSP-HEPN
MSRASETFAQSILDAENLLKHFNTLNSKPPPPELEVLKRAGLVMAMTAWETYVEDRVLESAAERLRALADQSIAALVQSKLDEEIKRLNNPTADKTIQLFRDYAGVDVTDDWSWNQNDPKTVCDRLNQYVKLRGDVVHRSRTIEPGPPRAHPVTKEDLERAIRFLKNLVQATEKALPPNPI